MPLGLISSENTDDFWSDNARRKIFFSHPNGTAPLTGLLSLADTEETPMPEFSWFEERFTTKRTTTAAGSTANTVFYNTGTTTTAGATFTPTAGTTYRIYLTSVSELQTDDIIVIHRLVMGSSTIEVQFRIVSVGATFVEAMAINTAPAAVTNNASTGVGLQVVLAGSAFAEGSRSRSGRYKYPSQITNYTQIFKTAFEMTRTSLKAPLIYDKSGDYKNQLRKNGIDHMAGIEWSLFFGNRRSETAVDPDTGETVSRRFMGGLLWYLKQWEKGTVNNGGAFDYRPSGSSDLTTETDWATYRDKRIIRLGGSAVSLDQFNEIEALPFQKTNSNDFCKLCLAGPGYIQKINSRLEKNVQVTQLRGEQYAGFDFKVTQRNGINGETYYKSHPLFNDVEMYNSAFYIDLGHLKFRPLSDSDTDIQQMIQLPDADKRKDQYLTEAGFEIAFPESCMFVDNLGGITL